MVCRPKGLSGVFNNGQIVFGREGIDCSHVRRLPIDPDGHDGPGATGDCLLYESGIHVPSLWVDIDEDRLGAEQGDHLGGRNPRIGYCNDFVARANAQSHHGDQ